MWRMLQIEKPDDYVLATGETHPVREFVERAFAVVGITIRCVLLATATMQASFTRWQLGGQGG
jgi:GDP-D-mannose dehydratase